MFIYKITLMNGTIVKVRANTPKEAVKGLIEYKFIKLVR